LSFKPSFVALSIHGASHVSIGIHFKQVAPSGQGSNRRRTLEQISNIRYDSRSILETNQ